MAENLGTVYWRVEADTSTLKKAEAEMDAVGKKATESGAKVDKFGDDLEGTGKRGSTAMKTLSVAIAAVVSSQAMRQVVQYADAWQNATNQLKTVQKETENLSATQSMLMAVANESRAGFETTANLYTRLSRSTENLNLTQGELIGLTETINKSFAVSGASAQEASNAIIQLSQGLAAGALRGEEFNSVSEQSPILMQAIADSLNMTRGELRDFAAEGGITAEIVVTALQEASGEIDQTFSKMSATFEQNMTVAKNNMLEFVGSSETVQRVTSGVGSAIVKLSENIDELGNVMLAAGVGVGAMGAVHLVNLARGLNIATAAQVLFNRAALLNPYVALGVGVATLSYGLITYAEKQREATAALNDYIRATTILDPLKAAVLAQFEENQKGLDQEAASTAVLEENVSKLIAALQNEAQALRLSGVELEVFNALTKAGVDASSEAGQQITALVTANYEYAEGLKASTKATEDAAEAEKKLREEQEKQAQRIRDTVTGLRQKEAALVLTGRQQFIYNALIQAGAMGNADQAAAVAEAASALYDLEEALKSTADANAFWTAVAKQGAETRATAERAAAEASQRNWERTHEFVTTTILDIADNGGSAFERLGDVAVATAKRIAAEWLALKAMNLFGISSPSMGGGAGGSVGGGIMSSVIGKGASAIGSAVSGGFATGGIGGAISGGAGAIGSGIAAIPGWGWALGGAALLASQLDKSTPSGNAGLLIHDAPGAPADQKFAVDPFASGFAPIGFARREDQAAANQVIDIYRQYDAALTSIANAAGITPNFSNNPFGGYDENAQGNGLFLGLATEDGKPQGVKVEQQLDRFVGQWIDALGGNITEEERNLIKSAGSADAMIAKAAQLAGVDGSHRNGLDYVPFDGYRAELHKGERVMTAGEVKAADSMGGMMDAMKTQMIRNSQLMLSILQRWDQDGLPGVRA